MKKIVSLLLIFVLMTTSLLGMTSCSNKPSNTDDLPSFNDLVLGEDFSDLKAEIKILTFRTDILDKLNGYTEKFKDLYPGITVKYEGVTDYESNAIIYLTSGIDWGDIMMIPVGIEKNVVNNYFISYGSADELSKVYNYTNAWTYENDVYGLASTGNANGLVYNKKVFNDAGVTEIPKTPAAFIDALKKIKANTKAIPLYTNYADEWPMSSWDAYMGINATGEAEYINQTIVHEKNPFSDKGNATHPYSVYKILYDAVSLGLTEPDYTTTSESLCYGMLNNGEIGCLALSSWAVVQAKSAGDNADDIGFMPFPITVDGKQYVSINGDYSYGINKKSSTNKQIASMLYVKWLIHESGYDYSEGGLSVLKGGKNPDFYSILNECEVMEDAPAKAGEETYFDLLNSETGLLFNANGNSKGQDIVEHAFKGDKTFDDIMNEWNELWSKAQEKNNISTN